MRLKIATTPMNDYRLRARKSFEFGQQLLVERAE
jgi:hypothetical protein